MLPGLVTGTIYHRHDQCNTILAYFPTNADAGTHLPDSIPVDLAWHRAPVIFSRSIHRSTLQTVALSRISQEALGARSVLPNESFPPLLHRVQLWDSDGNNRDAA
jgi:hypothetical protein